jgi:NADPH-dependent stearoyl-CoA 9-desaturase
MQNLVSVERSQVRPSADKISESAATKSSFTSEAERLASFERALDDLKREIEAQLGATDGEHIARIGRLSSGLERVGRTLLHFSLDPLTFSLATAALSVHKALELMEIGHPALHGCYDGLPKAERFQSQVFVWKAPVDETSWRRLHNVLHHQYTNIAGRDPDLDFGMLRLSARVPHRLAHLLQPLTNLFTLFGFGMALNLHATGMLDVYLQREGVVNVLPDLKPATKRAARRAFLSKAARYYGREYLLFPLLAGPFAGKIVVGNLLSDVARNLLAGGIIYCGHVGARDFAEGSEAKSRGEWYAMQVEAANDVEVPKFLSILCGALDKQIEHHLFPRLPPNRLREIAPRVREICAAHGVEHRSNSFGKSLTNVFRELRRIARPSAAPDAVPAVATA